jgi:hypothetical protein
VNGELACRSSILDTRSPATHEPIRALELREDAEALETLASAAKSSDQLLRRTALEVIRRHPRKAASRAAEAVSKRA